MQPLEMATRLMIVYHHFKKHPTVLADLVFLSILNLDANYRVAVWQYLNKWHPTILPDSFSLVQNSKSEMQHLEMAALLMSVNNNFKEID
jgi:hypothetical protein